MEELRALHRQGSCQLMPLDQGPAMTIYDGDHIDPDTRQILPRRRPIPPRKGESLPLGHDMPRSRI
jgi:hypothetical protein